MGNIFGSLFIREEKEEEEEISEEDLLAQCCVACEERNYSPKPMRYGEIVEVESAIFHLYARKCRVRLFWSVQMKTNVSW
eukprot:m.268412 g.268412  ORF g.268412 m.268412 type:complete len:80 (+) comp40527_c0_seq37:1180-1419(+)